MSKRTTPETDANEAWPASKYNLGNDSFVPAEFSRKLERERDEASKKANYQEYRIRYLESKLIKEINEANQDHLGWENKWKAAVEMAAIAENKVSNLENQLDLAMKTIKRLEAGLP